VNESETNFERLVPISLEMIDVKKLDLKTVPTEYSVQPMGDVIPLTRQASAIRGPARVG